MKFQFYSEALDDIPKLSVDGTVPNSIHFSHWEGNTTAAEVKADTSTEITLNLVASPHYAELTENAADVRSGSFDDGLSLMYLVRLCTKSLCYGLLCELVSLGPLR